MIKDEAIVLRATEYKEQKRIISLLSKQMGLISVLVKRISHKNLNLHSLSSPLHRCEYILRSQGQDFYTLVDGHVLDTYVDIRQSFGHLKAALDILHITERSQMPNASCPLLYQVLLGYLTTLKTSKNPQVVWASYALKLLKHEGVYQPGKGDPLLGKLAEIKRYEELHRYDISEQELQAIEELLRGILAINFP